MSMRFSILTLGDNYEHLRSHDQFYREVIEEPQYAEELSYEGFWIGEHHLQASQRVFPSPQMVLAAISQLTKRLRLRTGVSVLPVNDSIRLAEDLAELDLLSNGRVCSSAPAENTSPMSLQALTLPWSRPKNVADTTDQALREAEVGMKRKLGSSTKVWVEPGVSGYETFAKIGQFLASATIDQLDALSIFGDPARCVEKIKKYHAAGLPHLLLMFDWDAMPQKTIFHSMELFAKYMMPHFQEISQCGVP